jgi:hypothetical protein
MSKSFNDVSCRAFLNSAHGLFSANFGSTKPLDITTHIPSPFPALPATRYRCLQTVSTVVVLQSVTPCAPARQQSPSCVLSCSRLRVRLQIQNYLLPNRESRASSKVRVYGVH